jgi:hypothetical protein
MSKPSPTRDTPMGLSVAGSLPFCNLWRQARLHPLRHHFCLLRPARNPRLRWALVLSHSWHTPANGFCTDECEESSKNARLGRGDAASRRFPSAHQTGVTGRGSVERRRKKKEKGSDTSNEAVPPDTAQDDSPFGVAPSGRSFQPGRHRRSGGGGRPAEQGLLRQESRPGRALRCPI